MDMTKKETLKHSKAFDYYYSSGSERSYDKVGIEFKVTSRCIANWAKFFNWQQRVEQRDIVLSKKLQEKTDATILNTKANYRRQIKSAIDKVVKEDGEINLDVVSVLDYERLVKLDLLLMGEATERKEGEPAIAVYIPDNGRDLVSKPRQ